MTKTELILWWALLAALLLAIYLAASWWQAEEGRQIAMHAADNAEWLHRQTAEAYSRRTDLCRCGCDQEQPTTGEQAHGAVAPPR